MRIWAMTARRTTIRQLPLTEVVDRDTPGATPVSITRLEGGTIYHTVPLANPDTGRRRDARPHWIAGTFPLFPVVRLADGAPWAEANVCKQSFNDALQSRRVMLRIQRGTGIFQGSSAV
jgi:hypothetical protein